MKSVMNKKRKSIILSSILFVSLVLTGCNTNQTAEIDKKENENTITVATFNVDVKAPETDVEDQRKLLQDSGVDVFGIQEVDFNLPRYDKDTYNPLEDFQKGPYKDSYFGEAIAKGTGGYGNAVVSKYEFIEKDVEGLVGPETAPEDLQKELVDIYSNSDPSSDNYMEEMMKVWGEDGLVAKGATEPRAYTRVVFEVNNKKVAFYSTHLSVDSFDMRISQMKQLKKAMDDDSVEYKILVGDFNVDEGINEYNIFADKYKLANGYDGTWLETVAEEDAARQAVDKSLKVKFLDNIIVSDNIDIQEVSVIKTDLSDHYPVIAEIELN